MMSIKTAFALLLQIGNPEIIRHPFPECLVGFRNRKFLDQGWEESFSRRRLFFDLISSSSHRPFFKKLQHVFQLQREREKNREIEIERKRERVLIREKCVLEKECACVEKR